MQRVDGLRKGVDGKEEIDVEVKVEVDGRSDEKDRG